MDNQMRQSELSPVTRDWLRTLKQNCREDKHQSPTGCKRDITNDFEMHCQLLDSMEVRRPHTRSSSPTSPACHCICQREKTRIICYNCNYIHFGRVKLICPVHPRITFLMDLCECPQCLSSDKLVEENN